MAYKLFLDDYRDSPDTSWTIVRSKKEFCEIIEVQGLPSIISFDHDLTDRHYGLDYSDNETGADCAEWLFHYLKRNNLEVMRFKVHSLNPDAQRRIELAINGCQSLLEVK